MHLCRLRREDWPPDEDVCWQRLHASNSSLSGLSPRTRDGKGDKT
jgi:hypothetical protein